MDDFRRAPMVLAVILPFLPLFPIFLGMRPRLTAAKASCSIVLPEWLVLLSIWLVLLSIWLARRSFPSLAIREFRTMGKGPEQVLGSQQRLTPSYDLLHPSTPSYTSRYIW